MVLWTIYIIKPDDNDIKEFNIDNEKTFEEFHKIVSKECNICYKDLILCGQLEYDCKYNSKKLKEIIGIGDKCTLYAIYKVGGGGEIGISTVDISKNKTNEYEPSIGGPSYRIGCDGLVIQSNCKNRNCEAFNDTVYIQIGYVQNWSLFEHLEDKVKCPACGDMVKPLNYWFKNCSYEISFIKDVDGNYERGTIKGTANYGKYKTFNREESGEAIFVKLVFNVTRS